MSCRTTDKVTHVFISMVENENRLVEMDTFLDSFVDTMET